MKNGFDVSNFTSPLTDEQLAYVRANMSFVIIGLQDAAKARAFQQQFSFLRREYYVDRLGRDLTIPEPGSRVWVDIETGCFTASGDVSQEVSTLLAAGLQVGVYGNQTSMQPVIGDSTALAGYPLWYANYRTPDWATFQPFNGWTSPTIWQYSSDGFDGVNADLNVAIEEEADMGPWRREGNFWVFYSTANVPVWRVGDDNPAFSGRTAKAFGDPNNGGAWVYLRGLDDAGAWLPSAQWHAKAGD